MIEKMIEEMLKAGIIRNSRSPYASSMVLVKKNLMDPGDCVDYMALNKKSKVPNTPYK